MTRMQAARIRMERGLKENADDTDASSADKNGLKISENPRLKIRLIRVPKKNQRKSAL